MRHSAGSIAIEFSDIPPKLAAFTQARIDAALAPLAARFDGVKATLVDRTDRGGAITCEIRLRLVPSGIWVIRAVQAREPHEAVANAADAVAKTLRRQIARLDEVRRLTRAA